MPLDPSREGTKMICNAIRDLIQRSGVPVQEIADSMNPPVARQHIHRIMAGTASPSLEMIERIFLACGETFKDWLNDSSRYGAEKAMHEKFQALLETRGEISRTIRTVVDSLMHEARMRQEAQHEQEKKHRKEQDRQPARH